MAELGGGDQATVIGGPGLPAPNAAFANAMLCHGLDFDDTHSDSIAHVSVVTCPASLAVAEAGGASGRDALAAIVAANEIVTRVGMAASGRFHARGFHPTAVCGIFGATAAAARLGGLDSGRATSALGIAGSLASGVFAYLEDGTATKPIHPAWAAHGGLVAARLAAHGAEGPPSIFEGSSASTTPSSAPGRTRSTWRPARRPRDPLGDAPDRLQAVPRLPLHARRGGRDGEAGAGGLFPRRSRRSSSPCRRRVSTSCSSRRTRRSLPRTDVRGEVQPPVLGGRDGRPRPLRPRRATPTTRSATPRARARPRVRYETKDYPTYPAAFPGGVRITTRDGRTLEADLPHQRGGPENPMTPGEVREKYRENAGLALEPEAVEASRRPSSPSRSRTTCGAPSRRSLPPRSSERPPDGTRRTESAEQREIVATIREFVERDVVPVASELEHADEYPTALVETMKELGLFGVTIPEEYGGLGLDLSTYARIQVELSRGWMSLSGVLNTHFISGLDDRGLRNGGAAPPLPAPHGHRRAALRLLDDRAARRLRRPGDPHPRRPRGRRVRRHRPEDVGHQRPALERRHAARRRPTPTPTRPTGA